MELQTRLKEKLHDMDLLALAKKVGYATPQKGEQRIIDLVNEEYFGLCDHGSYDFVHSNSSLLKALCEALEIDEAVYEKTCYAIEILKEDIEKSRYKHIYIHTDFKRTNEPIFALAALESRRHLYHLDFIRGFTREHQIKAVGKYVKEHYSHNDGKLEFWGNIKHYVYYYDARTKPIIFDTEGNVVDEVVYESIARNVLK